MSSSRKTIRLDNKSLEILEAKMSSNRFGTENECINYLIKQNEQLDRKDSEIARLNRLTNDLIAKFESEERKNLNIRKAMSLLGSLMFDSITKLDQDVASKSQG
jgi:CII-binding regulator of phage lambda lysogenization HflD